MRKWVKVIVVGTGLALGGVVLGGVLIWRHTEAMQARFGALAVACRGEGVAAAAAFDATAAPRGMGVITRRDEVRHVHPYSVPEDALATEIAQASFVLCFDESRAVLLQSCPYGRGEDGVTERVVERYRYETELRAVEARSGRVLAQARLQGREPRACLEQQSFLKAQYVVRVEGEGIGNARLQDWVRATLAERAALAQH
jgi:hypothetical protein